MTEEKMKIFNDIPYDKHVVRAVCFCLDNDLDAYEGLAFFHPKFEAVSWFVEFAAFEEIIKSKAHKSFTNTPKEFGDQK